MNHVAELGVEAIRKRLDREDHGMDAQLWLP
jgi:hypothetical protein